VRDSRKEVQRKRKVLDSIVGEKIHGKTKVRKKWVFDSEVQTKKKGGRDKEREANRGGRKIGVKREG